MGGREEGGRREGERGCERGRERVREGERQREREGGRVREGGGGISIYCFCAVNNPTKMFMNKQPNGCIVNRYHNPRPSH